MKTKFNSLYTITLLLVLPATVQAQFNYTTNNGTITITGKPDPGGEVTSSSAMFKMIAPIDRNPVPGVKVTGEAARLLKVGYVNFLSPAPSWTTLGSVPLTLQRAIFNLHPPHL